MNITQRATLGLAAAIAIASAAHAGSILPYTGPTPYLGVADSPLPKHAFGYCNETFEDGTLDVPGVTGNGTIVGPGGLTDSVDEDDGEIDGSGTNGRSYFTGDGGGGITFTFPDGRTNGYPTQVGIVWTDGGLGAPVEFEAFGPAGESLGVYGPFVHADLTNTGGTGEDRFYGVNSAAGVSKINISNTGGGIEVDHLQLDHCIACGDTNFDLDISASDALYTLNTAVGSYLCDLCICDTNKSSTVTVGDALAILRKAVGLSQALSCPDCPSNSW